MAAAGTAEASGNDDVACIPLNLSPLDSVAAFEGKVKELGTVDVPLCNAGVSSTVGATADGFDMVFWAN